MKISISAKTDVGRGRENNEDAYAFCPDLSHPQWQLERTKGYVPMGPLGSLIVVADGMGGANAGEVASALATETLKKTFTIEAATAAAQSDAAARTLLTQAVKQADEAINLKMFDSPETAGMGTTIVVCWITGSKAYVAWCGDSRCYLYNDEAGLKPLTKDHSYVQELIDRGEITEEQAFTHPDNNIITRGLGDFDTQVLPDIAITPVKAGDTFLLCSDGLCGYCTNEQIEQIVADCEGNTERTAKVLLQKALDVPGDDNICIVVTRLQDDDADEQGGSKLRHFLKNIFG
ncbi:MAG: serine/threonine-protein phosphatase [Prevotella sp.]|jgi:protein phosphatase|nr:serine/threonine-protein phosphatase [Prevotella sp.]MBQ8712655.1 serine/threonine-protein phosphatase [Prevotella sp.]MBQ8948282.1 serine/threonine-protein phosphatase [Prevotella sp.]